MGASFPLDSSANSDQSLEVGERWGLFCVANPGSILSRLMVTGSSFVCAVRRRWTEQKETLQGEREREFPLRGGISVLFVSPQSLEGYIPLLHTGCRSMSASHKIKTIFIKLLTKYNCSLMVFPLNGEKCISCNSRKIYFRTILWEFCVYVCLFTLVCSLEWLLYFSLWIWLHLFLHPVITHCFYFSVNWSCDPVRDDWRSINEKKVFPLHFCDIPWYWHIWKTTSCQPQNVFSIFECFCKMYVFLLAFFICVI